MSRMLGLAAARGEAAGPMGREEVGLTREKVGEGRWRGKILNNETDVEIVNVDNEFGLSNC